MLPKWIKDGTYKEVYISGCLPYDFNVLYSTNYIRCRHTELEAKGIPAFHWVPTSSTTTETKFKNSFSRILNKIRQKKIKNRIQASEDWNLFLISFFHLPTSATFSISGGQDAKRVLRDGTSSVKFLKSWVSLTMRFFQLAPSLGSCIRCDLLDNLQLLFQSGGNRIQCILGKPCEI